MSRLSDLFKKVGRSSSTPNFSVDADTDIDSHKQEFQGIGKKIVAKKGATMNIDKSIHISLNDVPKDLNERKKLVDALRNAFFNEKDVCFVGQSAAKDISDYNSNPVGNDIKEALEYISKIAPEHDILCMKTGLYVRSLNERGRIEDAKRVRDNASRSARARNIINLASAGFIEGYVVPVCQASGGDATKVYSEIVEELPGIVFVNANMGIAEAMAIIDGKIRNREKYHWEINSISVNGLNKCVKVISDVREEIGKKYPDLKMSYTVNDESNFCRCELKIILGDRDGQF